MALDSDSFAAGVLASSVQKRLHSDCRNKSRNLQVFFITVACSDTTKSGFITRNVALSAWTCSLADGERGVRRGQRYGGGLVKLGCQGGEGRRRGEVPAPHEGRANTPSTPANTRDICSYFASRCRVCEMMEPKKRDVL